MNDEIDRVAVELDFELLGEQALVADVRQWIQEILVSDGLDFDDFVFDGRIEFVKLINDTRDVMKRGRE